MKDQAVYGSTLHYTIRGRYSAPTTPSVTSDGHGGHGCHVHAQKKHRKVPSDITAQQHNRTPQDPKSALHRRKLMQVVPRVHTSRLEEASTCCRYQQTSMDYGNRGCMNCRARPKWRAHTPREETAASTNRTITLVVAKGAHRVRRFVAPRCGSGKRKVQLI